jgi:hypothetical protein
MRPFCAARVLAAAVCMVWATELTVAAAAAQTPLPGGIPDCISISGKLAFGTGAPTRLIVGTLTVMEGGVLTVGTMSAPVPAGITAELVIANQPLNTSLDPDRFGTGLLGLGTVTMHGAEKTPTWTRLATEPRAGDTTLTLSQPVTGWRAGDRLILPDTRHLKPNVARCGERIQTLGAIHIYTWLSAQACGLRFSPQLQNDNTA